MIEIKLRTVHQKGVVPAYAEAFVGWAVNTPVTEDEYKRFAEELDKAKETARQIYLQTKGIKEEA